MMKAIASARRHVLRRRLLCSEAAPATDKLSGPARMSAQDGIIKLNVGGKQFITLRSTVAQSPTLYKCVEAAEGNNALLQDGTVFIDRDPALFAIVLDHMRNMASEVSRPGKLAVISQGSYRITVELETTSWIERRSLWAEASYYQLEALQKEVTLHQHTLGWYERIGGLGVLGSTVKAARAVQFTVAGLAVVATWFVATKNGEDSQKGEGGQGGGDSDASLSDTIIKASKSLEAVASAASKLG